MDHFAGLSTRSAFARPYLDSSEHGGTLDAVSTVPVCGSILVGLPAWIECRQRHEVIE
jgi:hypothetical protein